ncbi:uncharacterized protein LOC134177305 isoform X1 [Corticium candelabrum]|uniref:uncharacterized protein LOC134177305 isoform X1 n=1 Tax=Corticium candelabrum TaxID=121492 RepID=UPI002E269304|nr:uncharacterized protein LOC134177305 isoform X1 [Corticium candelabrum]
MKVLLVVTLMATLLPDAKSASENATNATSTRATATSATISVESTAVSRTLSTATTSNVITTDNSTAGTEATGTQDKVKQPVSTKASVHSATPTNAGYMVTASCVVFWLVINGLVVTLGILF